MRVGPFDDGGGCQAERRLQPHHQRRQVLGQDGAGGVGVVDLPLLLEVGNVRSGDEVGVGVAQRGEVVEDDGDDEVEEDECADDLKGDEVGQSQRRAAVSGHGVRVAAALLVDHRLVH